MAYKKAFTCGTPIEALTIQYYLSTETVKKIVYSR